MKNIISLIIILIFNFQFTFSQDSCDNSQGEVSGPLTSTYSFANWASVCNPEGEDEKIVDFEIIQDTGLLSSYALTNLWFFWSTDCETGPLNWGEGPVNINEQNIVLEGGQCIYFQLYDYYGYASASLNYSLTVNLFDASDAGCTDPTAFNFNSEALFDDGSCEYGGVFACTGVPGTITYNYGNNENQTFTYSTDSNESLQIVFSGAVENNYDNIYVSNSSGTQIAALTGTLNQSFILEDGIITVQLTSDGSVNSSTNSSYVPSWTLSCISEESVLGCTDSYALNYNEEATVDDGSCSFPLGIEVNLPFETSSTNCGSGDNINSSTVTNTNSATYYLGGEDISYSFIGDGSIVDINLTTSSTYTGLWVFDGNPNEGGNEIASSLSYNGNEFISLQTIEGSNYFVVLDSWPLPNCYQFDLSIIPLTGIGGCTDINADNYDETVDYENGSCEYSCPFVDGVDITTQTYNCYDYVVNLGYTLNQMINIYGFDCTCVEESLGSIVFGCTDENASNYNPDATNNDSSCVFSSVIDCSQEGLSQTYEYGDNENITFSYSNNEEQGLQIIFSGAVENNYDDIYIIDETGNQLAAFTGTLDGESYITFDSTIVIQLTSDGSVNSSTNSNYIPSWTVTCLTDDAIGGCTDLNADNYNAEADFEDSSCEYSCPFVDGVDITTQIYNCYYYVVNLGYTINEMINLYGYDCTCVEESLGSIVFGCTDENASNYDSDATDDDGSCIFSSVISCSDSGITQTYEYGNNENINFSYTNEDNLGMQITFSGAVENGYDDIFIYNESGTQIAAITGDLTNQYFATEESTITVQLISDSSVNSSTNSNYIPTWTVSCSNTEIISGCTETSANNYNPDAQFDDGSCEYGGIVSCNEGQLSGSFDYGNNENIQFTFSSDDGSNLELVLGGSAESCCDDVNIFDSTGNNIGSFAGTINQTIQSDDTITIEIISDGSISSDYGYGITWLISCIGNSDDFGCTNPNACNYSDLAISDDGSCEFATEGYNCEGECLETFTVIVDCLCNDNENVEFVTEFDINTCTSTENCFCECINDTDGDGVCDENEILGCTDENACNYDDVATEENNSCIYPSPEICDGIDNDCDGVIDNDPILFGCEICINGNVIISDSDNDGICNDDEINGCIDFLACNYNISATDDDGSCEYISNECDICSNGNIIDNDTDNDGICDFDEIPGCTDESALNYNSNATDDDGNCILIILGCMDSSAVNYNPSANTENGNCDYGPYGEVITTDCNMTILVPGDAIITIEGEPISLGDWIGVFYTNENTGELICGGSALWTGETTSVAAWGAETGSDNGFEFGEELSWGVFDNETGEFISNAQVTYSFGESTYQCNGLSGLESVNAVSIFTQQIPLIEGWGIWSTYIDPENSNMSAIFNEIVDDLIIAKDENGNVYWPLFGLNSIGSLTKGKGYQVKMETDATLILDGNLVPYDYNIELEEGWGITGYLHQECFNASDMMNPIVSNIIIVKDENGNVFWPMFGLNSIGNMCPGRGYQIKTNQASTLNYPALGGARYGDLFVERPIHFEEPTNTGNNMIIGLPLTSWESTPSIGDEIAAYGEDGELIGSTTFQGDHIALTIWGDDLTTDKKDGISEGESISFKLWNSQTGIEQALDLKWSQGVGFYTADGISIAGQIILGSELAKDKQLVRITDMLGREVNENEKDVMLLYIYDDGSIEREYIKE